MFALILGLIVWLALPLLFKGNRNIKKGQREALTMVCRILGIALLVIGCFRLLF